MIKKQCFKCKEWKRIDLFYEHSNMLDGHLNKCKFCTKMDVHRRYEDPQARIKIKEYERKRSKDPERKKKTLAYQRKRRITYKGKERARTAIGNAIRDGRIIRKPCEVCGNPKSEAHHKDYRKYYDVMWLCFKHHRKEHKKLK